MSGSAGDIRWLRLQRRPLRKLSWLSGLVVAVVHPRLGQFFDTAVRLDCWSVVLFHGYEPTLEFRIHLYCYISITTVHTPVHISLIPVPLRERLILIEIAQLADDDGSLSLDPGVSCELRL